MIGSGVTTPVVDIKMSTETRSSLTAHWLLPDQTAEWDAFVARHLGPMLGRPVPTGD